MEYEELIAKVVEKANVDEETAEKVVNAALVEAVSPYIFRTPGQLQEITAGGTGSKNNDCRKEPPPPP
jgi:hypothetical protein